MPEPAPSLEVVSVLAVLCTGMLLGRGAHAAPFPLHAPDHVMPNQSMFPTTPTGNLEASWMAMWKKDGERISCPRACKLLLWVGFPGMQSVPTVQHPAPQVPLLSMPETVQKLSEETQVPSTCIALTSIS